MLVTSTRRVDAGDDENESRSKISTHVSYFLFLFYIKRILLVKYLTNQCNRSRQTTMFPIPTSNQIHLLIITAAAAAAAAAAVTITVTVNVAVLLFILAH